MLKKATVIGHFDWKNGCMIGAVVKARNIYEALYQHYGEESVSSVDIYGWRKRKVIVLISIVTAFMMSSNIVLVCSDTSSILMSLFSILKHVFHNKIHYCVVGGDIAERLTDSDMQVENLKMIDTFFVETTDCIETMNALGIKNVQLMRNFKCIKQLDFSEIEIVHSKPYHFCTFSRVVEQKGITDAMQAIERINIESGLEVCRLDIYGAIDDEYKSDFKRLLSQCSSSNYCGCVDSKESVDILKKYFCLLFPTKYQTEGIPGTIVDAFAAGVPVICSNWCRCSQIVHDGIDGIVYPFDDYKAFIVTLKRVIECPELIESKRKSCLEAYNLYRPEIAIEPLINNIR